MRLRRDVHLLGSRWAIAFALMTAATLAVTVSPAGAAVALSVTVTTPPAATVGQRALSGTILVQNVSTPPQITEPLTIGTITLVPSCGTSTGGSTCPAGLTDPGDFELGPSAIGQSGTACAGVSFVVNVINQATGEVSFVPPAFVALALGAPASATATCGITFSFSVLKVPTHDAAATSGIQTDQLVAATGTYQDGNSVSDSGSSTMSVAAGATTLTGTATPTVAPGSPIMDVATLGALPSPAAAPTGAITFDLYGPTDTTCSAAPVFTDQKPVTAAGAYTSTPYMPMVAGSYRWRTSYSGDASHSAVTTACGDTSEVSVVAGKTTPTIAAVASSSVGGSITATATLTGAASTVSGNIVFEVYGPDDLTCSLAPVFTDTEPLAANGSTTSAAFMPKASGTYLFVAGFVGDANDAAVASTCNAANSTVMVTTASASTTTITTNPQLGPPPTIASQRSSTKNHRVSAPLVAVAVAALALVLVALVIFRLRRRTAAKAQVAAEGARQEEVMRSAIEDMHP